MWMLPRAGAFICNGKMSAEPIAVKRGAGRMELLVEISPKSR